MKTSIIITCFSEQKNKRITELQIQRIRFDETTEIYQQFENGPRVMSFSL